MLSATNARTVSIAGTSVLALDGSANLGNVTTLDITGAAGFTDEGSYGGAADPLAEYASLSTINGASSTNAITATINAHQSFAGGSGSDTVTISSDQLATDNLGSGSSNTLIVNNVGATFTAANTGANVTGYSKLETTASASGTYDLAHVFHSVGTVEMTAAPQRQHRVQKCRRHPDAFDRCQPRQGTRPNWCCRKGWRASCSTLNLGTGGTTGIDTTNSSGAGLGTQRLVVGGYRSAVVNSLGNGEELGVNKVLLADNQLGLAGGTLTITGNESLDIGSTLAPGSGKIGIIDVTSFAGTTTDLTKLGTTSKGVTLTAANGSVLFNGYAGSIKTDTVTAGSGNNVITEKGAGGLIVTAQNGDNTISSVGGVLNVTLGNGNNSVIGNNATALIVEGNGSDYVSVGTGSPSLSENHHAGFRQLRYGCRRLGEDQFDRHHHPGQRL